jgi:2-keto-4-pentenoate hydratase
MTSTEHDVPGGAAQAPMTDVAEHVLDEAGDRLVRAHLERVPCPPVRDLIGRDDVAAGYEVQQRLNRVRLERGAQVVGRKIGATSEAVQTQLGVDQPDFGVLFDDMAYDDGDTIPIDRLIQPRAEAEVAFVLAEDLADGPLDVAQVRGAIAYAVAALEIVDSRIADWDISFADTVADNASSGLYVLGAERRTLDEVEPVDVTMSMTIDGEEVSTGNGAACLGDPLRAVAWLAHQARTFGEPLRAGQVVLSGALGPMRPVAPGAVVTATISGLGTVTARFSQTPQDHEEEDRS